MQLKSPSCLHKGRDRGTVRREGGVGSGRISDGVKNDQNFKCSLEPREHSPKIFWWFLTPFRSNFCLKKLLIWAKNSPIFCSKLPRSQKWRYQEFLLHQKMAKEGSKNQKNFFFQKKYSKDGKKKFWDLWDHICPKSILGVRGGWGSDPRSLPKGCPRDPGISKACPRSSRDF